MLGVFLAVLAFAVGAPSLWNIDLRTILVCFALGIIRSHPNLISYHFGDGRQRLKSFRTNLPAKMSITSLLW